MDNEEIKIESLSLAMKLIQNLKEINDEEFVMTIIDSVQWGEEAAIEDLYYELTGETLEID